MSERTLRIGLAVICVLFVLHVSTLWYYTVEDAYISFRYARNLAGGHGLVFNPGGERVEGYTNFLWVLLLAGAASLGLDPVAAAKVLGTLLGLGVVFATAHLVRRLAPDRPILALAGAALAASSAGMAVWSSAGLETPLFTLLLTGGLVLYGDWILRGRSSWWAGLVLGLAAWTRPEALLVLTVLLAVRVVSRASRRQVPGREEAGFLLAAGALVIPQVIFRWAYYGDWLPNSYYVKSVRFRGGGWSYLRRCLPLTGWTPIPLALAGLAGAPGALPVALGLSMVAHAAWVVHQGGDWMPMGRYLVPWVPTLAALGCLGLDRLLGWGGPSRDRRRWVALLAAGLVVAGCVMAAGSAWIPRRGHDKLRWESRHVKMWREIGLYLAREADPQDVLVTGLGGVIPYYSNLPTLDRGGLMNRDVARIIRRAANRRDEDRRVDEYVLARRPEIMLIPGFVTLRDRPLREAAELGHWQLWRNPEFRRFYHLQHARIPWEGRLAYLPYYRRIPPGSKEGSIGSTREEHPAGVPSPAGPPASSAPP